MQRDFLINIVRLLRRGGLACLALSLAACGDDENIKIKVHYLAPNPAPALTDLRVFAGDDKYSWPSMASGETQSVTLKADPQSEREVVLLYAMDGRQQSWDGPKLGRSRQGYRVYVQLGAAGVMTSRYCALPCSLDD
jgi:hypothetical protein